MDYNFNGGCRAFTPIHVRRAGWNRNPPPFLESFEMNLGQLVRSKMKELNADKSGEYIDNRGNHFKMSADGEGYAISYGGGKSVEVTREQGCKLVSNCRKLNEGERKELGAEKTVWEGKVDGFSCSVKTDATGKFYPCVQGASKGTATSVENAKEMLRKYVAKLG
jgi:hypothetical protein